MELHLKSWVNTFSFGVIKYSETSQTSTPENQYPLNIGLYKKSWLYFLYINPYKNGTPWITDTGVFWLAEL